MSGSDPSGYGWLDKVFGDSSGYEGSAFFAGGLGITGGAYITSLPTAAAQFSGLGGAIGIGQAAYGLNDPGANAKYARPTGELGSGAAGSQGAGVYNEGAVPPPGGPDARLAENCDAGRWTEQGCQEGPYAVFGGLYIPVVAEMYFGVQAAWTWLFGAGSAAEASTTATAAPKLFSSQEVQGLKQLFGTGLQGAQEGLKRVVGGARGLPPGVTRSTLERYRAQIMAKGFENVPVQQERLRIITELLK